MELMAVGHIAAAKSIKDFIDKNYEDTDVETIDCIEYINKYANKISTKAYVEIILALIKEL